MQDLGQVHVAEAADHAGVVVLVALDALHFEGSSFSFSFSLSLSGWAMSRHEVPLLQRPPGPWVVVLGSLAEGQA